MAAKKTTAKKPTTRAKKAGVNSRAKKSSSPVTIGGIRFREHSCHNTKAAAKKKAMGLRKDGWTARVVDRCVLKGRKRKGHK